MGPNEWVAGKSNSSLCKVFYFYHFFSFSFWTNSLRLLDVEMSYEGVNVPGVRRHVEIGANTN